MNPGRRTRLGALLALMAMDHLANAQSATPSPTMSPDTAFVVAMATGTSWPLETSVFGTTDPFTGSAWFLTFQDDGNFVLYSHKDGVTGGAFWASNVYGVGASHLDMQTDCNLVVYTPSSPVWSSRTDNGLGTCQVVISGTPDHLAAVTLGIYNSASQAAPGQLIAALYSPPMPAPTASPTTSPPTLKPTTSKSTTRKPTTRKPTTRKPTTRKPTTRKPTTLKPTTLKPTTRKPTLNPTPPALSQQAAFTTYTSWAPCCTDPDVDQTECVEYNACEYAGWFAALPDQMSEEWVQSNDLVAFYDNRDPEGTNFLSNYGNRYIQVTKGSVSFTALIADTCGNGDCNGCCEQNSLSTANGAPGTGFLVDMEYWTVLRHFGNIEAADGAISFSII